MPSTAGCKCPSPPRKVAGTCLAAFALARAPGSWKHPPISAKPTRHSAISQGAATTPPPHRRITTPPSREQRLEHLRRLHARQPLVQPLIAVAEAPVVEAQQ